MTILSNIAAKIRSECPVFENRVSISRNYDNPEPTVLPECWVAPGDTTWAENTTVNITTQLATRAIDIKYAVKMEDETEQVDHHAMALSQLIASLLGYQVGTGELPLELETDIRLSVEDGYVIWRLSMRYEEHDRG